MARTSALRALSGFTLCALLVVPVATILPQAEAVNGLFDLTAQPRLGGLEKLTGSRDGILVGINQDGFRHGWEGVPHPQLGLLWAGEWNSRVGFRSIERDARAMHEAGWTPVVLWYYWGDSISPGCVRSGCDGRNVAEWFELARGLAIALERAVGDGDVVVVLENEFNKGGIARYEPFDGLLADQARTFRKELPGARIALGFGGWGVNAWTRFDRAAEAVDWVGFQHLRSSRRDVRGYTSTVDVVEDTSRLIHAVFGKPAFLYDLGLSTYPEPTYAEHQARVLSELAKRAPELAGVGLVGVVYRDFQDNPRMATKNHHGVAERHWGLVEADGDPKPGYAAFRRLLENQPGGSGPSIASLPPPPDLIVLLRPGGNAWWVQVKVVSAAGIAQVEARAGDGPWNELELRPWGAWARALVVPKGDEVAFRVVAQDGRTFESAPYSWPPPSV